MIPDQISKKINFRTLDLNLLRVFDEVMVERSLTRAAQKLSLTQPAISNAMRRLREAIGDDLLKRNGQALEPTARAQSLWPVVRESLKQLQDSLDPDEFNPLSAVTTFIIAMADATAAEVVPALLEILEQEAPGVSLRIVPLTTRDPRELLRQELADLAVGYFPAAIADLTSRAQSGDIVSFEHSRLFDGEYVCVMRKDHPLSQVEMTLDLFCSCRHLLVSFSGRPFGFIDESLAALGKKRRVVGTVNQFATAGRVVLQTNLLTVLPRHFVSVAGIESQLVLKKLPFESPIVHVDMLWHHHSFTPKAQRWLRSSVERAAALSMKSHLSPIENLN
jgi:DNA-binding transcriptional LysR family regulator